MNKRGSHQKRFKMQRGPILELRGLGNASVRDAGGVPSQERRLRCDLAGVGV